MKRSLSCGFQTARELNSTLLLRLSTRDERVRDIITLCFKRFLSATLREVYCDYRHCLKRKKPYIRLKISNFVN